MSKKINIHRNLTTEDVYNIVHYLIKTDLQQKEISKFFDVRPRLISHIKKGEIYRDVVSDSMLLKMNKGKIKKHRRLSEDEVNDIKSLLLSNKYEQKDIALKFKVDPSTITRIKKTLIS